jgi:hypothetical protein
VILVVLSYIVNSKMDHDHRPIGFLLPSMRDCHKSEHVSSTPLQLYLALSLSLAWTRKLEGFFVILVVLSYIVNSKKDHGLVGFMLTSMRDCHELTRAEHAFRAVSFLSISARESPSMNSSHLHDVSTETCPNASSDDQ